MSKVLGVDPGMTYLGFGAVQLKKKKLDLLTYGMISHPRDPAVSFTDHLNAGIEQIVNDFPRILGIVEPHLIVIERVPVGRLGSNDALVVAAWTTVKAIAFQFGVPVLDVAASTVKKELTGDGQATKTKVRNAVFDAFPSVEERHITLKQEQKQLGEKAIGLPQDVFDGIAIAVVGMRLHANQSLPRM